MGFSYFYFFSAWKEILMTFGAALLGMPGGVLLFLPVYHPLHDLGKVHTENTFFILFAIYLLVIWSADRQPRVGSRPTKGKAKNA